MLSLLFLMFAAAFNALMDTLSHHYSSSIFKYKNPTFWNPNVSWQYAPFFPGSKYRVDAWHLAKSAMIFNICFAIIFFNGVWWHFFIFGAAWNLTFNLFYNKLLKSK